MAGLSLVAGFDVRTRTCSILAALANRGGRCYSPVNQVRRRSAVTRLIIAMTLGVVLALGGTVLATKILASQANGAPVPASSSLYQYGTR